MNEINALLLLICVIPAVSYAWGMRGTTIGGEKGAMLPGAVLGALFAHFSGILIVQEHFYIFAALGAVGMYFGGCMTYGETLSFSMSAKPAVNMKKGLLALLIKGFLWYAVFGAVFSTGVNAICGVYKIWQLILMVILTPVLSLICLYKLNRPCNSEQAVFPKIYFSKTRKESWGAMVGIAASLLIVNITTLRGYSIIFTLLCGISGGIGWVIGQGMYIYIRHYAGHSSSPIIRFFSEKRRVDGWKAMECTFGAVAGMGSTFAFLLTYQDFKQTVFALELQGSAISLNNTLSTILLIIWLILLLADMVHYFINRQNLNDVFEAIEFILYAAVPFVLISLGDSRVAKATSFFLIFWVIVQEVAFEMKHKKVNSLLLKLSLSFAGATLLIISLTAQYIPFSTVIVLYTIVYEALTLLWLIPEVINNAAENRVNFEQKQLKIKEKVKILLNSKGMLITHGYFILTIVLTLLISL